MTTLAVPALLFPQPHFKSLLNAYTGLTLSHKRAIRAAIRKNPTTDYFLPFYGMTVGEFAVAWLLNSRFEGEPAKNSGGDNHNSLDSSS